jgi:hypothetical protein
MFSLSLGANDRNSGLCLSSNSEFPTTHTALIAKSAAAEMGAKHYIFAPKIGMRAPAATGMRQYYLQTPKKDSALSSIWLFLPSLNAITALLTSPSVNMIARVTFAISLPEPMAIPKSTLARAGASFMPPLQPALIPLEEALHMWIRPLVW